MAALMKKFAKALVEYKPYLDVQTEEISLSIKEVATKTLKSNARFCKWVSKENKFSWEIFAQDGSSKSGEFPVSKDAVAEIVEIGTKEADPILNG